MASSIASPKAPGQLVQTGSGLPLPNVQDGITAAPPVPVAPEVQPPAELPMLTSKAKPPSRTEETMPSYTTPGPTRTSSNKRSRPRKTKDRKIEDPFIVEELVLVDIIEETMHQLVQDLDIKIVHHIEVKLHPDLLKLPSQQDVTFPILLIKGPML